jgi:hypothetical protein
MNEMDLNKRIKYQNQRQSIHWVAVMIQAERRTDMENLTGAFRYLCDRALKGANIRFLRAEFFFFRNKRFGEFMTP